MAIKRFGDYEKVQAYSEQQKLPRGGYIVEIKGATVEENKKGQYIKFMCDIAEGDFKDYYLNDWNAQSAKTEDKKWHCNYFLNVPTDDGSEKDGWTKRKFKTIIGIFEDNNSKFHFDWDEKKFKGLKIGALFNMREYVGADGSTKQAINLAKFISVDAIREGKYQIPDDVLLQQVSAPASNSASSEGFMSIPDGAEDEGLPF